MKHLLLSIISVVLFLSTSSIYAEDGVLKNVLPDSEKEYVIRMENGDILSGYVTEMMSDPDAGDGMRFKTEIGTAMIYEYQILEIRPVKKNYRHNHRVYFLPTAEPIGDNHFVSVFELLFLYGGFGISDWFSFTAGHSMIPGIRSDEQITSANAKFTFFNHPIDEDGHVLSLAAGGNLAFINDANRIMHFYGVSTMRFSRTTLTAMVFYKTFGQDYDYKINMYDTQTYLYYPDGQFGISLGIDTKFSTRHDLHFIAELWNKNVTQPTSSGVLIGLRLCNSNFSTDFGISFFASPFVAPFVSFVWTPFK
ncbi:MAG: hypothetical protein PF588_00110 [Candidatus Kapabacteria bacterium]|jgi:hypothetical protein|nr:hypothetical protein [Candidatus Kapabacteria bacterium]